MQAKTAIKTAIIPSDYVKKLKNSKIFLEKFSFYRLDMELEPEPEP